MSFSDNLATPAILAGSLLLAVACSGKSPMVTGQETAPPPAPIQAQAEQHTLALATTAARVWAALPGAYKAVGITVNATDESTRSMGFAGTIRNKLGDVRLSTYFNCGNQLGENADHYDIHLFIATQVGKDPKSDRILVTTGLRVAGQSPQFASTKSVCITTGELERRLQAALRAQLKVR